MLLGEEFLYLRECKSCGIVGHHATIDIVVTLSKEYWSSRCIPGRLPDKLYKIKNQFTLFLALGIVRYLNSNTSQSDSPFLMDFFPSSSKQLLKKTSGSLVVLLSTAVMSTLKREREREREREDI